MSAVDSVEGELDEPFKPDVGDYIEGFEERLLDHSESSHRKSAPQLPSGLQLRSRRDHLVFAMTPLMKGKIEDLPSAETGLVHMVKILCGVEVLEKNHG